MSATDFGDVVTAAGLAVPSTIVRVAGVDESPEPSIAMNAPSARAAPIAAEAISAAVRDAVFFMGGLLDGAEGLLDVGCSSQLRSSSEPLVSLLRISKLGGWVGPRAPRGTTDVWPNQPPRSMTRAPSRSTMRPGGAICRLGRVTTRSR